ncbi:MAG: hypothetical protein HQM10_12650 [Candidatus Riflebacteria bacterium]|nr:hypothetical protein [Candidatus Riflebacteria bacterium]
MCFRKAFKEKKLPEIVRSFFLFIIFSHLSLVFSTSEFNGETINKQSYNEIGVAQEIFFYAEQQPLKYSGQILKPDYISSYIPHHSVDKKKFQKTTKTGVSDFFALTWLPHEWGYNITYYATSDG